eukprot:831337-Rhodomonas_salina.3
MALPGTIRAQQPFVRVQVCPYALSATQCAVLAICYAVCGTELPFGAAVCCAKCGTGFAYRATAKCGTERGYGGGFR